MDLRGLVLDYGGVLTDVEDARADGEPLLHAAVRRLRGEGIRTALLSNADAPGPAVKDRTNLEALFDVRVFAGVAGLMKPAAASYLTVAHRLGLVPRECVFVDDLPRNVAGAVAVGMVGVHHRGARETVAEWEVLFECQLLD